MTDLATYKLSLIARLVTWRWWYVAIGILIVSGFEELSPIYDLISPVPGIWLIGYFLVIAVFNVGLWLVIKLADHWQSTGLLIATAWISVLGDLLAITVLLYLLSGNLLIIGPLYLWPIISAIVLFSWSIALAVAGLTVITINAGVLWLLGGQVDWLITLPPEFFDHGPIWLITGLWSIIYLAVAAILGYQYRLIKTLNIFNWQVSHLPTAEAGQSANQADLRTYQDLLNRARRAIAAKNLEIKMMNQQLAELEQAKSKFVSVTTHQMRTPLSAIKWTLNMMLSGHLGDTTKDQKTFLQKGLDSTQRLITIVNNLMHVGDVKTSPDDFNWHQVDLIKLIDQVIDEFANQLKGKNLNFQFIKPKRPLPAITADADKLKIVLENLLDNAIKYNQVDGQVTIKVIDDKINAAQSAIEVVVTDTGIGIPREEQKKIFHKFFRASNAINLEPDGSGIGLYICKDLIEKHGGTLWFESVSGEGTKFHFTLPLTHPRSAGQN